MKKLLSTTAVALMLTTPAFAADTTPPLTTYEAPQASTMHEIRASELLGMRIYSVEQDFDRFTDDYAAAADEEKEWDDIGEVNDVILSFDGKVEAVVLGVGGFIGIGEKDVAVPMDQLKVVREEDDQDDFFLVVNASKQTLTDAQAYERPDIAEGDVAEADRVNDDETLKSAEAEQPAVATGEQTADASQSEGVTPMPAQDGMTTADGRTMLPRSDVEKDGYQETVATELTSDELVGARVYDANEEDIGEVDSVVLSDAGQVENVILDVGGFLGIGEKEVAVTFDELQIMRAEEGGGLRIYVGATREQLEAQPDYE